MGVERELNRVDSQGLQNTKKGITTGKHFRFHAPGLSFLLYYSVSRQLENMTFQWALPHTLEGVLEIPGGGFWLAE